MIKQCAMCGTPFEAYRKAKFCENCRPLALKELKQKHNILLKEKRKEERNRPKHDPMESHRNIVNDLMQGKYHGVKGANAKSKEPWFKGV